MNYGDWFKKAREERGWAQAWVARRIGISRAQMNNIEAGRSRAGAETLQALCSLFDTTPRAIQDSLECHVEPNDTTTHPGIEALAGDAHRDLRESLGIEDWVVEAARRWKLYDSDGQPVVIRSVKDAVQIIQAAAPLLARRRT